MIVEDFIFYKDCGALRLFHYFVIGFADLAKYARFIIRCSLPDFVIQGGDTSGGDIYSLNFRLLTSLVIQPKNGGLSRQATLSFQRRISVPR
jgi:hypothetical protein